MEDNTTIVSWQKPKAVWHDADPVDLHQNAWYAYWTNCEWRTVENKMEILNLIEAKNVSFRSTTGCAAPHASSWRGPVSWRMHSPGSGTNKPVHRNTNIFMWKKRWYIWTWFQSGSSPIFGELESTRSVMFWSKYNVPWFLCNGWAEPAANPQQANLCCHNFDPRELNNKFAENESKVWQNLQLWRLQPKIMAARTFCHFSRKRPRRVLLRKALSLKIVKNCPKFCWCDGCF